MSDPFDIVVGDNTKKHLLQSIRNIEQLHLLK